MAKKKQNYYQQRSTTSKDDFDQHTQSRNNASNKMDQLAMLPLPEKKRLIRQLLIDIGTNVEKNDGDPTGDGDQTPISTVEKRDMARHLWATGGDILEHFTGGKVSKFAMACASGDLTLAQTELQRVKSTAVQPFSACNELTILLETRETSMRLSPLLLIVSLGKNLVSKNPKFESVAKLLLKNGASPVAKDVVGKTAAHYGAGGMATKMTLEVTDMCIRAAKSHHLFGKKVKLSGLKTEDMNGKVGIVGGFDPDSDRRGIYLTEENREVWVKVDNIMLMDSSKECQPYPLLTDIQDRLGAVSLHELVMPSECPKANVAETAEFLLKKWNTSIYTQDCDGCSPIEMASGMGQLYGEGAVVKLIMEAAIKKGRDTAKARRLCANCNRACHVVAELSECTLCKVVPYCSRDCQKQHWKVHKKECAGLSSGVQLGSPKEFETGMYFTRISNQKGMNGRNMNGRSMKYGSGYKKPRGVKFDEKFVIKCQGNSDMTPILIYDETRGCNFHLGPEQKGFKEILETIRNEPAWLGRKTFMKASFDESGICTVYTDRAGVKTHYSW